MLHGKAVGRSSDGGNGSVAVAVIIAGGGILPFTRAVAARQFGREGFDAVEVLLAHSVVGGIKVGALVGAAPVLDDALVGGRVFLAGKFAGMCQRCGKGQQDKEFFHVDSLVRARETVFWRVQAAFE